MDVMRTVRLSMGEIDYTDTGGPGRVVLLCHGLLMDASVWDDVVALCPGLRVVRPTFPFGAHHRPLHPDADLSFAGQIALLTEFVRALDLSNAVLVVSDLGYPLLYAARNQERLAGLVVLPCEAFDNIPPGLPGRVFALTGRVSGGLWLPAQALRLPGVARLPMTFGWMSHRPIPRQLLRGWTEPAVSSQEIRRDLVKYTLADDYALLADGMAELRRFQAPALIVWSRRDRLMPPEHAQRLADLIPTAQVAMLDRGGTLLQLDAADVIADLITRFVAQLDPTPTHDS
jgi:pimeloyl-ACP methyl ester carboxylesterase